MKKIELNPIGVLLCFFGLTLICLAVFGVLSVVIALIYQGNFGIETLQNGETLKSLLTNKTSLIIMQLVSTIGAFLIPGLLITTFFEGYSLKKIGHFSKAKPILLFISATLLFYGVLLTSGLLHEVNQLFPISDYWKDKESQNLAMQKIFIEGQGMGDLIISIIVVALFPAVLEEFTFRGVGLYLLDKTFKNKHVAVLLQGIFFGLIHLNMGQVIPIMAMGILFGYIAYESKSIWYTVLIHFLNNTAAVVAVFYANSSDFAKKLNDTTSFPKLYYVLGLGVLVIGLYLFFKQLPKVTRTDDSLLNHLNE